MLNVFIFSFANFYEHDLLSFRFKIDCFIFQKVEFKGKLDFFLVFIGVYILYRGQELLAAHTQSQTSALLIETADQKCLCIAALLSAL